LDDTGPGRHRRACAGIKSFLLLFFKKEVLVFLPEAPIMKINRGDGIELAYASIPGREPTLVFLPGFMSDMSGDKATMLAAFAAEHGFACLRLDYSGHGASGGRFEDGTIGRWTQDALAVIDRLTEGPLVVVGSSMGGWIALLVALARPERVVALVGVAAAPDFTEALIWEGLSEASRAILMGEGVVRVAGPDGREQVYSRDLIEDGRRHLLLGGPIGLTCKVRLLHGQLDADVPWETSIRLAAQVQGGDVRITLVKDGGHRLSRAEDLAVLRGIVGEVMSSSRDAL
jgi:pimeloyl-ACP methyl ester carboxylesterase